MADELPPAFKAATAVLADRDRPPRLRKPLSIRCAAERFSVSPSAVKRALATLTNPEPVSRSPRPAGRPRALTRDEDELLISYVLWLQRGGFPMAKAQLVAAANDLRRRKNPEAGDLGKNWYSRWLSEQPELADTYARIQDTYSKGGGADKGIKSTEASNVERVMTYFDNLKKIIALHRIGPSECWNEDEGSLRVGCLGDEVQVIVVRTTRSQVLEPSNQEPSSLIGVANAAGESIAPFVVFKTLPFSPDEPVSSAVGGNGVHFAQSETGFSNADISLEWLHHFNYWSWKKSVQAQRSGKELEDWFGYDMWLRDPESPWKPPQKISRIQRPEEEKIYRLLVLDGSAGHTSLDFIEYCMKFDIIVAIIPSDFHYILQPLDLGVLQPLKHAYQRVLQNTLDTHSSFTQPDFIKAFKKVYEEGFTKQNIISGFREAGIYPPNAQPSVMRVFSPQKNREVINPPPNPVLPSRNHSEHSRLDRNRRVEKAARRSGELAQPSRQTQPSIPVQPSMPVQPSTPALSAQTAEQIRQHEEWLRKQELKRKKAELREGRRGVQIDMEKLRSQWQDDRLQRLSTGQRRLTFKGWLDHTGKAENFAFLENLSKEITALLKENDYSLFDIPEGPSQQQQQAQRQPNTQSGAIQPASPAEPQSPVDVTMSNAGDDSGEATHTQENLNTLDGDVSAEDDFHSLPPSPR